MSKKEFKTTQLRVAACSEKPAAVVASFFSGLNVDAATAFDLYHHPANGYLLHGENSTLEYNAHSAPEDTNDYVVALYDPAHKSVELFRAPMVHGLVTSLEHRVHKGPKIKLRGARNAAQRTALGEAFGTKKAKAAIASLERNRIDADKLHDMELDIVDNVKELTLDLPTREQLQDVDALVRPTPPANVAATAPEDVYALHAIVPKKEWAAVRVQPLLAEEDAEKRLEMMPYPKSAFVAKNLPKYVALHNTEKVAMVYYASLLFGIYHNRRVRDKTSLLERMDNRPAEALVDGALSRFAVGRTTAVGKSKDRSFVIDPFHEDKLLCYLIALLFHIEGFTVEILPLANELNMKPTRLIGLLRALGAVVKPIGVGMADAIGLLRKEAATYKVAQLKVPFKLPEMVRRGGKR